MKNFLLFTFCLLLSGVAFGQGTETFTGISGTSTSYSSRSWTGVVTLAYQYSLTRCQYYRHGVFFNNLGSCMHCLAFRGKACGRTLSQFDINFDLGIAHDRIPNAQKPWSWRRPPILTFARLG